MRKLKILTGLSCLFYLFVCLTFSAVAGKKAEENLYSIKVLTDKSSALYKPDEEIIFLVQLLENKEPLVGKKLVYIIKKDGAPAERGVVTSSDKPVKVKTELKSPGFVLCTVTWKAPDGKNIRGYGGAGVDPLEIEQVGTEPEDFDKFWNKKKAELEKDPMKPVLTPVPVPATLKGKVESFDVQINCPGGAPLSGYFARPVGAKPKSLPAFISYHGAGVRSSGNPYWRAAQGMLALDINAHGLPNGKPKEFYEELRKGKYKGYPYWNSNSREKSYFLGMFLRVYRALQFMKSQPEWDGKTLIVYGSSQGGGQALVAAGLEPKVSFCAAMVPALCDHLGIMEKRQSGWPRFIRFDRRGKPTDQNVVDTSPYFDAATFAKRINADSIVSVGFIDTTCCPTSVYAAYNNIQGKKEIINNPLSGHHNPKETADIINKKIKEHIEGDKKSEGTK